MKFCATHCTDLLRAVWLALSLDPCIAVAVLDDLGECSSQRKAQ